MRDKKTAQILFGTMNLMSLASSATATATATATAIDTEKQNIEQLNSISLKSIESSWLKVPNMCKARGFNANPTDIEQNIVSKQIQNIYSSYEV